MSNVTKGEFFSKVSNDWYLSAALYDAIDDGNIGQVSILLRDKHASPNIVIPEHDITPFHRAVGHESQNFAKEVTKLLLQYGGSSDTRGTNGVTVLHIAAAWNRSAIVRLLLSYGADPWLSDDDGINAFQHAYREQAWDALRALEIYRRIDSLMVDKRTANQGPCQFKLDKVILSKNDVQAEYVAACERIYNTNVEKRTVSTQTQRTSHIFVDNKKLRNGRISGISELNTTESSSGVSKTYTSNGSDISYDWLNCDFVLDENNINKIISHRVGADVYEYTPNQQNNTEENLTTYLNDKFKNVTVRKKNTEKGTFVNFNTADKSSLTSDELLNSGKLASEIICNISPKKNIEIQNASDISVVDLTEDSFVGNKNEENDDSIVRILSDTERAFEGEVSNVQNFNKNDGYAFINHRCESIDEESCDSAKTYKVSEEISRVLNARNHSLIERQVDTQNLQFSAAVFDANEPGSLNLRNTEHAHKIGKDCANNINLENTNDVVSHVLNESESHEADDTTYSSSEDDELYTTCIEKNASAENEKSQNVSADSLEETNVNDDYVKLEGFLNMQLSIPFADDDLLSDDYDDDDDRYCRQLDDVSQITNHQYFGQFDDAPRITNKQYSGQLDYALRIDNKQYSGQVDDALRINNKQYSGQLDDGLRINNKQYSGQLDDALRINDRQYSGQVDDALRINNKQYSGQLDDGLRINNKQYSELLDASCMDLSHLSLCDVVKSVECEDLNDSEISDEYLEAVEEYMYTDVEEAVALTERRSVSLSSVDSKKLPEGFLVKNVDPVNGDAECWVNIPTASEGSDYDTDRLRSELKKRCPQPPGPITKTTKRLYLRKLRNLKKNGNQIATTVASNSELYFSAELEETFNQANGARLLSKWSELESSLNKSFAGSDDNNLRYSNSHRSKTAFTYLLLDPRVTRGLPKRSCDIDPVEAWKTFLRAIFYIGKGKCARPYSHLYEAYKVWRYTGAKNARNCSTKVRCILEIWESGEGVICLHVFQNTCSAEAFTREAAMIDAIGLHRLKNERKGNYHGIAKKWNKHHQRQLGAYLLNRAMMVLIADGERALKPADL